MSNFLTFLKKIYIQISKKIGFMVILRDERKSIHTNKLKKFITSTGTYYLPKYAYQDVIRKEIIKNRIFDKKIFDLGKKFIEPNSVIIDAGANYGQMSILFSKIQPQCIVHSFEASKFIYKILKKNVELNAKNIITYNCALSDKNDEKYLAEPDLSKSGTYGALNIKIDNNSNNFSQKIEFKKIDDFVFKKKVSLMKIDVQGWDLKVLYGSIETIKRNRMPIIFEYEIIFEKEMKYKFEDFVNFFKELNYSFETVVDNNFLVVPKELK